MSKQHTVETAILRYLRGVPRAGAADIASAVATSAASVQDALHRMNDGGLVLMKNGFYRLSRVARVAQTDA